MGRKLKTKQSRCWKAFVLLFITGQALICRRQAQAQGLYMRRVEEPQWLRLRITEAEAGIYSEGTYDQIERLSSGQTTTYERIFIGPLAGFGMTGSVYHPNFFQFTAGAEGSYGWSEQSTTPGTSRNEWQYLGNFRASGVFLANKPYNGSIFGSYGRGYHDYDFFNRVTTDTLDYGASLSYRLPAISLNASYAHQDQDILNQNGAVFPSSSHNDVLLVTARNDRSFGGTTLTYTFNNYETTQLGLNGKSVDHSVALADNETFGAHDQINLGNAANYIHRETPSESSDEILAHSSLDIQHKYNISTHYNVSADHFDNGTFQSDNYNGQVSAIHQFYQSLTSELQFNIGDFESSTAFDSGYVRTYGGTWSENYTKALSADHRLRINNTLTVNHTDQKDISRVENERHTFGITLGIPDSFALNLPNVLESTIVVDPDPPTGIPYLEGLDYLVVPSGTLTIIQRPAGSRIPIGSTVLVSYRAEPRPPGGYETLSEAFTIRFELWRNLWGIYARVDRSLNNAPEELNALDSFGYAFGTDVNWRWILAGAEYSVYESNQTDVRSARFYENFSFHPDVASSLGVNCSQSFSEYQDPPREDQDYRIISRYRRGLAKALSLSIEGGVDYRRGTITDQTLGTARAMLDYSIGKMTINLSYDYQYSMYQNAEERNRHMVFLKVKRAF